MWTNKVSFRIDPVISSTNPVTFNINPVIFRINPIILRSNPVIFRTSPPKQFDLVSRISGIPDAVFSQSVLAQRV